MTTPRAAAASNSQRPAGGADPRPGVLVVEDDAAAPDAACDLVRRLGYRVTAASGMPAGLTALRETQFGVLLLAWQTADTGAAEGLRQLRRQARSGDADCTGSGDGRDDDSKGGGDADSDAGACNERRFATAFDTPAIALLSPGQVMDRERLRELGFDDQLARPLRASQVRSMLNKHLAPPAAPAVAPTTGSDVLDPDALARLAELDPTGQGGLIERVLQAFQSSAARARQQAADARRSDDRKTLRLVAHTLKSSSASIGALRLSQLCAGIEDTIRTESGDDLGAPLDAMAAALDEVLASIDHRLKKDAP